MSSLPLSCLGSASHARPFRVLASLVLCFLCYVFACIVYVCVFVYVLVLVLVFVFVFLLLIGFLMYIRFVFVCGFVCAAVV
jgi:hypothetical protein